MINVSLNIETPALVATTAILPVAKISQRAACAIMQSLPSRDADLEERRWQLEWDRRNVED